MTAEHEAKLREYLRRAMQELHATQEELLEARAQVSAVPADVPAVIDDDPVAIVAMACRFPGGVDSPEGLWALVEEGRDAVTPFPTDRGWDPGLYDPEPGKAGRTYTREGGFLHEAGEFDAGFFGISPREATVMDPQQRLLLETSWEALERAGLDPHALAGTRTGVYAGVMYHDYNSGQQAGLDGYSGTGTSGSVVSGRVSYALGLEGPAVSVDTACSSSLVTLHLAAQALRAGECDLALAGGVTVMASPSTFVEFSRQRGLAADGRCRSFADDAEGTGWSEGAGMLLVERLSDARRNGHPVLAVLRGSAVNQDGASNGLTAPNGPSQERVIRAALAAAGLGVEDVDAVEAHGTGTTLGDPIEANALLATYGTRAAGAPLYLGSLKSNLGHTQAAAGVAGVIKSVMALRHGRLARSLHVDRPSSHVNWSSGAVEVLREARDWPPVDRPRRVGVSAFGVSGTNAHAVLEQAPAAPAPEAATPTDGPLAVPLSGRVAGARDEAAGRLAAWLREHAAADLATVAVAAAGRTAFEHRSVVLADGREDLLRRLDELAAGDQDRLAAVTGVAGRDLGRTVFVFPGQGAQWLRMGLDLAAWSPVFAAALDECAEALRPHTGWDLREVLADEERFARVEVVQPASWAVMVSLAALSRSLGVEPDAVLGHSQGEIAAAVVAGALTLDDGARVVALRSQVIARRLAGHGGMASVALGADEVAGRLTPGLSVAAHNAPDATVVSGEPDAVAAFVAAAEADGLRARVIPVDYASHSSQVEAIEAELAEVLGEVPSQRPRVPFLSTVTGERVTRDGDLDAGYWYRSLRQPVRFAEAVRTLLADGFDVFVETAAHPVLSAAIGATAAADGVEVLTAGSLRRDDGGPTRFLTSLAEAWTGGLPVTWSALHQGLHQARAVTAGHLDLPTYPFQRRHFWLDPAPAGTTPTTTPTTPADDDSAPLRHTVTWPRLTPAASRLTGRWAVWTPAHAAPGDTNESRIGLDEGHPHLGTGPEPGDAARKDSGAVGAAADADATGAATAGVLAEALRAAGAEVVVADDAPEAAFAAGGALGGVPFEGVLLVPPAHDPAGAILRALAALAAADPTTTTAGDTTGGTHPRLWVLTSGAVAVSPAEAPDPAQASVWGLGLVAALEHPDLWGGLIDLPTLATGSTPELRRVPGLLGGAEDELAVRGSGVHVRRLAPAPAAGSWRPEGTVLVVGDPGPATTPLRDRLQAGGAEVVLLETAETLRQVLAEREPGAVVVAPPSVALTALDRTTPEALAESVGTRTALVAEVVAALEESSAHLIVLSSVAGTWGGPGQGAYAAGTATLDALVAGRRAAGKAATTVAWVPFAGSERAEGAAGDQMRAAGLTPLEPGPALEAMWRAAGAGGNQSVVVADLDPARFTAARAALRPARLLADLPGVQAGTDDAGEDGTGAGSERLRELLEGKDDAGRQRALLDLVRRQAAGVLGLESPGEIEPRRAFQSIGFNSVTALELRNRVEDVTGLSLPATLVFDHPDPDALARHLAGAAGPAETPRVPPQTRGHDGEPIAIVSMACRFPGGVSTPEGLWRVLEEGRDVVGPFPTDRGWDLDNLYDPDPDAAGRTYAREGGFLEQAAQFDAAFFGISPREAIAMDPQQRLLLETAWEALERAGIDPDDVRGSDTGVYAGTNGQHYLQLLQAGDDTFDGHLGTGNSASVLSGRLSYVLGLEGPAMTVDTACSASLVALHLAVRALRAGECGMALVGGATVMSAPEMMVEFSSQRVMSATNRSRPFAEGADGVTLGEGAGVLVVERLSDARRNGHPVLAVVRGSAVNQDGASNGLTAPNGPSQQRVIEAALADAGLGTGDVDVVEAHGTGTELGDPIEAQALIATYGRDRDPQHPLRLGSIKSNMGHTQAAAGVAGVMKMVLALRHDHLPRTLHVDAPSPRVAWDGGGVELLTDGADWKGGGADRPRRAAVSAFGISGTNAHLILEDAPEPDAQPAADVEAPFAGAVPLLLSARTAAALRAQAGQLLQDLSIRPELDPADAGLTLLTERSRFAHRGAAVGTGRQDLLAALGALSRGEDGDAVARGVVPAGPRDRVAFVFPGQGSQWPEMAAGLMQESTVFRRSVQECDAALAEFVDWSVEDVLTQVEGAPSPSRVDVVQPLLFTMMVSLAAVWRAAGIEPAAVVGHSQGEIAAAYVAGGLTLQDAARIVALRSQAWLTLAGQGGMMAVSEPAEKVRGRLGRYGDRLSVAAVNSPGTVAVAGEPGLLDELLATFEDEGVQARRIPGVDTAGHTAQVDALKDHLMEILAPVAPRTSDVPFYSTVTGGRLDTAGLDAAYWYRNMREPVEFEQATRAMAADGLEAFLESSPHPMLAASLEETLDGTGAAVLGTLRRGHGGAARMALATGAAFAAGVEPGPRLYGGPRRHVDLPTYPFQRERFWYTPPAGRGDAGSLGLAEEDHPLLGAVAELPGSGGLLISARLGLDGHPWLADHALLDTVLVPAAGLAELALRAGRESGCPFVEELTLAAPLVLPDEGALDLRLEVGGPAGDGVRTLTVHSRVAGTDDPWTRNADATLRPEAAGPAEAPPFQAQDGEVEDFYATFAERGYDYGPAFRGFVSGGKDDTGTVHAEVVLPAGVAEAGYGVHPALLDAALQAMSLGDFFDDDGLARIPFALRDVQLHRPGARRLRVVLTRTAPDTVRLLARDEDGEVVLAIGELLVRPVDPAQLAAPGRGAQDLHHVAWVPAAEAASGARSWAVLGADPHGVAGPLREAGATVVEVPDLAALPEHAPDVVVLPVPVATQPDPASLREVLGDALGVLQQWLAAGERVAGSRLVVLSRGAVSTSGEGPDPVAAAVWGLVRSAQSEEPGQFVLLDTDHADTDDVPAARRGAALLDALGVAAGGEGQVALRGTGILVPRLRKATPDDDALLLPDDGAAWRLGSPGGGTLADLRALPAPDAEEPLGPGQVRVAVRAAGLNFRDTLIAVGMYPGEAVMGAEGSGVVLETAADVEDLAPGDAVFGLWTGGLGPRAVADRHTVRRLPSGWTHDEAAGVPAVFLTVHHALTRLATLGPGQKVLVHAATGGVGMAALQLASSLGLKVYATASPAKWDTLRELGIPEDRISTSRSPEFAEDFLAATNGEGVDLVLNALTGEMVDASLRLLPRGGTFVELGKADLRDAAEVAAAHAGVDYRAFDLSAVDPSVVGEELDDLLPRFAGGALTTLPTAVHDVRRAREAFRELSQARHRGKLVLRMPPAFDTGPVLVTGGTGTLGRAVARHLVSARGARHVLLAGRRGADAPGVAEQVAELEELGATVEVRAADVADPGAVADLMRAADGRAVTAVVHAAGVLDDGTVPSLDGDKLDGVLRPKADALLALHAAAPADLSALVTYSSSSSLFGSPGQGGYAAANAFADAFAQYRHALGRPAVSLAWGLWEEAGSMAGHLDSGGLKDRMARGGVLPLPEADGLALFDAALRLDEPLQVPIRLSRSALRAAGVPPFLSEVAAAGPAGTTTASGADDSGTEDLAGVLAALDPAERLERVLSEVRGHAAAVLGHGAPDAVPADQAFRELGFDSLTAVEMRNRLTGTTGLRLPATLVFDHPTVGDLAGHLHERLTEDLDDDAKDGGGGDEGGGGSVAPAEPQPPADEPEISAELAEADDEELFALIDARYPDEERSPS